MIYTPLHLEKIAMVQNGTSILHNFLYTAQLFGVKYAELQCIILRNDAIS